MDIRQALHYLGEITREITTDDLLANIFSKFSLPSLCIAEEGIGKQEHIKLILTINKSIPVLLKLF
jgi:hypothetical protein